ncbi:MAG TPA: sigma-54 dependent transcriptional regulator [Gammaproteobacteria bacterium]|nr:sigma-54 dependent transcriptional regulator [Gammaproteobacteria bacterium]
MSTGRILVVDDEADIRSLLEEILSEEGYEVVSAANAAQAREHRAASSPDLVLLDIWMPDADGISLLREWSTSDDVIPCPVVMMSGHATVETAVEATRLGAFDFIEKPVSLAKLLRTVERGLDSGRVPGRANRQIVPPTVVPVGRSRIIQAVREQSERVAAHATPVLVTGEPGSGREAFAHFIHSMSPRASGPFIRLVAGALPDASAEALLFGREVDGGTEPGFLERARGGTLFVNELSDLGPTAQRLLHGALENNRYTPVGGAAQQAIDARIISSAPPGFEHAPPGSGFRRELLSDLAVVVLKVPPLRDYAEDVPELLRHYLDQLVDRDGLPFRRLSVAAQNRLRNYPWPGNVRELRNLVQRLLILGGEEEIGLEEVEQILVEQGPEDDGLLSQDLMALPLREAREQFERAYLQQQLQLCDGKVGQLAKRVGMERTHLYRKLRALGIDFRSTVSDD